MQSISSINFQTAKSNSLSQLSRESYVSYLIEHDTNHYEYKHYENADDYLEFAKLQTKLLTNRKMQKLAIESFIQEAVLNIKKDDNGIRLEIDLTSDYILDPTLFYESLAQKGCRIISIKRDSNLSWEYYIDISTGFLNTQILLVDDNFKFFKASYSDYWFKIDESANKIIIKSMRGNHWYPHITFYDEKLNILAIKKFDKRLAMITLKMPNKTVYCRISDIYRLNNIHNGLEIKVTH